MPISTPTPVSNPYSAAGKEATGTGFEGAPKERSGRSFRFNPKGKYVALANQMRHDQQLEELKQRIAESAKKAGLDSELGIEKNIKVSAPNCYFGMPIDLLLRELPHLKPNGGTPACFPTKNITTLKTWVSQPCTFEHTTRQSRFTSSTLFPFLPLVTRTKWLSSH